MSIEELLTFIPPPTNPIDGEGDWSIAEGELSVAFPQDFKAMIRRYGTGQFYGDLYIFNPLAPWGRESVQDKLRDYRDFRDATEIPMALFPESPGLLPWGSDGNGHLYCWWADGTPDEWGCVQVFHGYEDEIEVLPGPITRFLVRFMQNEYPNTLGGQLFDETDRFFVPNLPWLR